MPVIRVTKKQIEAANKAPISYGRVAGSTFCQRTNQAAFAKPQGGRGQILTFDIILRVE